MFNKGYFFCYQSTVSVNQILEKGNLDDTFVDEILYNLCKRLKENAMVLTSSREDLNSK